jgi:GH15 family glucan-1,4-alpha-glucosidase
VAAGGPPSYYPAWPRDGAIGAVALARLGLPAPAKRFLGTFFPRVQEPDGSFRQCYDSRGGNAGIIPVENDQQPIYAWAVREVSATVILSDRST